jgi:NAD-dependent SIR2 family protein deacetylase
LSCPAALEDFIFRHRRLFILTGAGCSTNSGIPDYRDRDGNWKRTPPVTYQDFIGHQTTRQRYWARSLIGWQRFGRAQPNPAHLALARLEAIGRVEMLLTQNVDRLHQSAGSANVIDLHGRLDLVRCMGCDNRLARDQFQTDLVRLNPGWSDIPASDAPDGDADLVNTDCTAFQVPVCPDCGGTLKPDVVFFGENVPKDRVETAIAHLRQTDAMLVVGSSLMIFSGFRFVRMAAQAGISVAAVNLGRTRADDMLSLKIERSCDEALAFLL